MGQFGLANSNYTYARTTQITKKLQKGMIFKFQMFIMNITHVITHTHIYHICICECVCLLFNTRKRRANLYMIIDACVSRR